MSIYIYIYIYIPLKGIYIYNPLKGIYRARIPSFPTENQGAGGVEGLGLRGLKPRRHHGLLRPNEREPEPEPAQLRRRS